MVFNKFHNRFPKISNNLYTDFKNGLSSSNIQHKIMTLYDISTSSIILDAMTLVPENS